MEQRFIFGRNTAPFLMYSHARAKSIQRKGGVSDPSVEALQITDGVERDPLFY